jgi:hypothetical protein
MMDYLIGIVVGLVVSLCATWIGFDRDRSFYPTIIVVIACYYALFAVIGAPVGALLRESVGIALFIGMAVLGFKRDLRLVVAAFIAHGTFDLFHARLIDNPGVAAWWPPFCLACDVVMAAYLAWLLGSSRLAAKPARAPDGRAPRRPG